MTVVDAILIGIIVLLVAMVGFFYISQKRNSNNNQTNSIINIEPLQKDIEHSKEILQNQIEALNNKLADQNKQLSFQSEIINNFKDNYADSDKTKAEKITSLIKQNEAFQNSLSKKENDYKLSIEALKRQLEIQSEIINNFKDTSANSDKAKTEKIASLIKQLDTFQGALDKKENDYKLSSDSIKNQVTEVIKDLATLKESSMTLSKINDSVQNLQEVFINTKKRGNVGEYLLEKILTNMLGSNEKLWQRQYKTADGKIVDAYIKTETTREGIAIDSKFSIDNYQKYFSSEDSKVKADYLKNFRKDIRSRIDEVTKYINIKNNISNAIMFIPSEEIFAFIYANFPEEVVDYAFKKRVWLTSPTTLSAVLFAVDKNIKDVQFNRNIEKIRDHLIKIKNEFDRWVNRWEKVKKDFNTVNDDIKLLDTTHDKLSKQYNNILEMPEELKESE